MAVKFAIRFRTFFKAQASALISSGADYLVLICLVQFFSVEKFTAGIAGLVVGGVTNFIINHHWVFEKRSDNLVARMIKYFLVWAGNFVLNAAGYKWMLSTFPDLYYFISRVAVAIFVGIFYNYVLQRWFVFK